MARPTLDRTERGVKVSSGVRLAALLMPAALARPAAAQMFDVMPPSAGGDLSAVQAAVLNSIDSLGDPREETPLQYGGLTAQAYYNLTETYDTNIFLAPPGGTPGAVAPRRASWIMDNNLGFKSVCDLSPHHEFKLAYDFTALHYQGDGGAAQVDPGTNDAIDQSLAGRYAYTGPDGVTAKLLDDYVNTTDPADTELTARDKRWENLLGGEVEYSPAQEAFVSVDAEDQVDRYIADNPQIRALLDRVQTTVGGRAGWYVGPKTKVFAAYHFQDMHFTDDDPAVTGTPARDNRSDVLGVGVEGEVLPKVTAQFQTGFTYTRFAAAAQDTGASVSRIWSFNGGLNYKPWEKTEADLTINRGLVPAVLGANQYYTATSAGLSFLHRTPANVTLEAHGSVERDDYGSPISIGGQTGGALFGNAYMTGVGAAYDFSDWARATVNYVYVARFSNFAAYDYIDHRTSVTLTLRE
jgi:hypothetical protein